MCVCVCMRGRESVSEIEREREVSEHDDTILHFLAHHVWLIC